MATATAVSLPYLTVDEYLSSSHEPDADYVDGVLEERNLGEMDHADLQSEIVTIFRNHRADWKVKAFTELRVQVAATRFRVPDVCILHASQPRTPIVRNAPLLCIEVLSPEDRFSSSRRKYQDYLDMGVHEVWVFNPESRTVFVLRGDTMTEHRDGSLNLQGTQIELSLPKVFAALDLS
jgi:Uma2 family endonuclease